MKIKLLTAMAGARFAFRYGDIVDMPDDKARRMIEKGQAEPYRGGDTMEVTVKSMPQERAVSRVTPFRGRRRA